MNMVELHMELSMEKLRLYITECIFLKLVSVFNRCFALRNNQKKSNVSFGNQCRKQGDFQTGMNTEVKTNGSTLSHIFLFSESVNHSRFLIILSPAPPSSRTHSPLTGRFKELHCWAQDLFSVKQKEFYKVVSNICTSVADEPPYMSQILWSNS